MKYHKFADKLERDIYGDKKRQSTVLRMMNTVANRHYLTLTLPDWEDGDRASQIADVYASLLERLPAREQVKFSDKIWNKFS
ncbi:MAG: hypothetical protein HC831_21650 [Chloroflexia bacterium]|nr:hypothetical protein [Chloroflexia bacterium]